jgi:hypothetical protein
MMAQMGGGGMFGGGGGGLGGLMGGLNPFGGRMPQMPPGMGGMPGMGGPPMTKKMLRVQKAMLKHQQRELDANKPRPKKDRGKRKKKR